ncbi:MAG: hypothetical protein HY017_31180 [Betaproteobacteria bacterium]|nr:hypothetical protein [Betaproteobacteria bacterium]
MGSIGNRELLVARWAEVINDPALHDLPYKIELNAQGTIETRPANNWHAAVQAYLSAVRLVYLSLRQPISSGFENELARDTRSVIQSRLESLMPLSFNRSFFFYFPHPLAEGNV